MNPESGLDRELQAELCALDSLGLRRVLPPPANGEDFSSNDYLGLSRDPAVLAAARSALSEGAGGRAARLLGGGSRLQSEAEEAAASWLGAEAALLFPSGYQANLGVLTALTRPGDLLLSDQLNHASLIDAARLSRARVHVYRHGDFEEVERLLQRAPARRTFVVTESIFSMDGDAAPLRELALSCARHGAHLIIDEAHAVGVLGPMGRGLAAARDIDAGQIAASIFTGGKALGAGGAFVAGRVALRDLLLQRARSFIFTTAPPPAVAGALLASIACMPDREPERERCRRRARELAAALRLPEPAAAIVPFPIGSATESVRRASELQQDGFDVRAVRPPTVPEQTSRLRIVCHAFNPKEAVERLAARLAGRRPREAAEPTHLPTRRAAALFVAGTDTEVGKTCVSALLVRAAARRGPVQYWKPTQTGPADDTHTVFELARPVLEKRLEPGYRLALPASPHTAAAAEGGAIEPAELDARLREHCERLASGTLVTELAGGLLVPLTDPGVRTFTQLDWLEEERARLVLVARSGLGTLNHTLLSLEALRARHIEPLALFLVGPRHAANEATLQRMSGVEHLFSVPHFAVLDAAALAAWLEAHPLDRIFDP